MMMHSGAPIRSAIHRREKAVLIVTSFGGGGWGMIFDGSKPFHQVHEPIRGRRKFVSFVAAFQILSKNLQSIELISFLYVEIVYN